MITLEIYEADSPATLISDVPESRDRNWLHQLNDPGSGTAKIHKLDTELAANPSLLAYGNIVHDILDGTDRFAWIIETRDYLPAPANELAGQYWTIGGRGVLALLEDAIVYPEFPLPSNTRQRFFDFTAIAYDESGWIAATEVQQYGTNSPIAAYAGEPTGWPDTAAIWIWSRAVTGSGVPAGTSYFRKAFTLADETAVSIFATCDNNHQFFLDGEMVLENFPRESAVAWDEFQRVDRVLGAGTHQIAVKGINYDYIAGGTSPAALLVTVMEQLDGGALGDVVVHTDDSWVCLDYPASVPGMTIGEILRILIDEGQTRGALTGITVSFDDGADSNASYWDPAYLDIALDIGMSYLDVLRSLVEQYVDVEMSPSLVLSVYNKGSLGDDLTGSVSLQVGVDFEELASAGEAHVSNAILARDSTGLLTIQEDATSQASHKRQESYLELAQAPSESRAQAISTEVLVEFAYPVLQVSGRVTAGSGPYVDWQPGDQILVPDPLGVPTPTNIISLAVSEDEAGHPVYSFEGMQTDSLDEEFTEGYGGMGFGEGGYGE